MIFTLKRLLTRLGWLLVLVLTTILAGCDSGPAIDPLPVVDKLHYKEYENYSDILAQLHPSGYLAMLYFGRKDQQPSVLLLGYDPDTGFTGEKRELPIPTTWGRPSPAISVDSDGNMLFVADRHLICMDEQGKVVEGFAEAGAETLNEVPKSEGRGPYWRCLPGRFVLVKFPQGRPDRNRHLLYRVSPEGKIAGRMEFAPDDFKLLGPWNEPDSICFLDKGKAYKWVNSDDEAAPIELTEPVPEGFTYCCKLEDGGWYSTSKRMVAFLDPDCRIIWSREMPEEIPDYENPSPWGDSERLENWFTPGFYTCDGEVFFGRGFISRNNGRAFDWALVMCRVPDLI